MMQIKVENGMASVFTPYNSRFVEKIKNIGGRRWNAAAKCWTVPESEIETVRKYMMDVYGETDLPADDEKITVQVTFPNGCTQWHDSVTLFGKVIARATGRDSGARIGDDVTLISGGVNSGGSMKNWETVVQAGTVVRIRNVPKAALAIEPNFTVEAEEIQASGIDRQALREEKEKLLARLEEIEKLLATD